MRSYIFSVIVLGALAGCVSEQAYIAEMAACEEPGPRVAVAKCQNAVMYKEANAPRDVMDVMAASRESVASKVDKGEMSEVDGRLQVAQIKSQLTSEIHRRGQAEAQTTAAILAATPAAPRPVNCTSTGFGNMVTTHCN